MMHAGTHTLNNNVNINMALSQKSNKVTKKQCKILQCEWIYPNYVSLNERKNFLLQTIYKRCIYNYIKQIKCIKKETRSQVLDGIIWIWLIIYLS